MRLLDILLKPAELWRMGLECLRRCLGHDSESRRLISEQQATIAQLRDKLHLSQMRVDFLENIVKDQKMELTVQKHGVEQMWKFIHTRHRLNVPAEKGSIREILQRLDRQ